MVIYFLTSSVWFCFVLFCCVDQSKTTPTLHVLTPLTPPAYPPLPADALGPEVCLATDFYPKDEEMILNVRGGPVSVNISNAVLSTKTKTYYFVGFSNETIHSCELLGASSNNEAGMKTNSLINFKPQLCLCQTPLIFYF